MTKRKEKAILVGCLLDGDEESFYYSLEELASLTNTAGGEVICTITQKRDRMDSSTYIGKGKLEELKHLVEECEPDLVIFNDELSPSQIRHLSDALRIRIIDRTQLILDIFARRARSKEGKLQVELAQLQYLLPRLTGRGAEFSRLGGGIGTRGPGETKLESDRRHIRRRIHDIKQQLQSVVQHRERYRSRRKKNHTFRIALVGYTNAGKSTLFNRLTAGNSLEENQLFATLDPLTKKVALPSGFTALLSDTVGFIQDLPTTLIAAFRSTLEEVREADLLLHIVDSSHPDYLQHEETVNKLLSQLNMDELPRLLVYNKIDQKCSGFVPVSKDDHIMISALSAEDRARLKIKIEQVIKRLMIPYRAEIPADKGKLLARIKTETILHRLSFHQENHSYSANGYVMKNHPLYGILEQYQQQ